MCKYPLESKAEKEESIIFALPATSSSSPASLQRYVCYYPDLPVDGSLRKQR